MFARIRRRGWRLQPPDSYQLNVAVMSAEVGAVIGTHGMVYETIKRNLALLKMLWDSDDIAVDRRSGDHRIPTPCMSRSGLAASGVLGH